MTTRTKLAIAMYSASIMMLLNVFSKPLHIPDAFQWVLMIGVFIPLGFTFYFIKLQKLEKQQPPVSPTTDGRATAEVRQGTRNRLILIMVLGCAVGLSSPLWLPLTGTPLGPLGNFICGIITTAIVCVIFGFRLRKL